MQSVCWDCKKENMKKIIAILLVLGICGSFAACSEPEKISKTDIVGEWMAPAVNAAATFNEDGTGELTLNGTNSATWEYDADKDQYIVNADKTYYVAFATEYDMPILNVDGIDFYRPDDYDKAYTLLISRRYEEIIELTGEMEKLEQNRVYDIANGVTIEFTGISVQNGEMADGILLEYLIMNNRTDAITQPLYIEPYARLFLADSQIAVEWSEYTVLAASVDASAAYTGSRIFSLNAFTEKTILQFGRVIGAVIIELNGEHYYIDLGDLFRSNTND